MRIFLRINILLHIRGAKDYSKCKIDYLRILRFSQIKYGTSLNTKQDLRQKYEESRLSVNHNVGLAVKELT